MNRFLIRLDQSGLSILLILILCLASRSSLADFITDDGENFHVVRDDAINNSEIEEWQIRLYKKGDPVGTRKNWGSISGSSAAIVSARLKVSQEFQISFARWANKNPEDDVFTYSFPYGPIAVLKKDKAISGPSAEVAEQIGEIAENIEKVKKLGERIDFVSEKIFDQGKLVAPEQYGLGGIVGTILKLASDLKSSIEKANKLAEQLNGIQDSYGWSEIERQLKQLKTENEENANRLTQADALIARNLPQPESLPGSVANGWNITKSTLGGSQGEFDIWTYEWVASGLLIRRHRETPVYESANISAKVVRTDVEDIAEIVVRDASKYNENELNRGLGGENYGILCNVYFPRDCEKPINGEGFFSIYTRTSQEAKQVYLSLFGRNGPMPNVSHRPRQADQASTVAPAHTLISASEVGLPPIPRALISASEVGPPPIPRALIPTLEADIHRDGAPNSHYPHVVWTGNGNQIRPDLGYIWIAQNPAASRDYRVKPLPDGTPYLNHTNVVWTGDGTTVRAVAGYTFVSENPGATQDYTVKPLPEGTLHKDYPNVVWTGDGRHFRPAAGYTWVSDPTDTTRDYRVKPLPDGTPYLNHTNVVWTGDGTTVRAVAGYTFVSENPGATQDYTVKPLPEGTLHKDYPNVVWTGDGRHFRPAAGYTWVSIPLIRLGTIG